MILLGNVMWLLEIAKLFYLFISRVFYVAIKKDASGTKFLWLNKFV